MTRDELLAIAGEGNVRAYLQVIRACEGTAGENGYRMLFGGTLFDSFDDHPKKRITTEHYTSTAAGAYQIIEPTWTWIRQTNPTIVDFTPDSQDAAAVALLIRRRALDAIRAGDLDAAVELTNEEWASLPGSPYGQPRRTMEFVRKVFAMFGGREPGSAAPIENRTQPTTVGVRPEPPVTTPPARQQGAQRPAEGKPMSPFILPALDALVGLLPTLARLFKGEQPSAVAQRNVAAVEAIAGKVLPMVQQAVDAPNLQAAVESIQELPELARKADEAVKANFAELHELTERMVQQRQDFAMRYNAATNVRTVLGRFTFVELVSLWLLLSGTVGAGYVLWHGETKFGNQLVGAVVMLVVIAGIEAVRQFWIGSSNESRRKTDALLAEREAQR